MPSVMQESRTPPPPDPKCDLDYFLNVRRAMTVRAALSNSFGFGRQNASVIIRKYQRVTQ
jgi:3-oxoacyl-[acyl-carrier-protein] synthase II